MVFAKLFDIVIKNVKVVDGTENPWYEADVGISKGKIDCIGEIDVGNASTVIDGEGYVLSPGFIDTHGHCDLEVFHDSSLYNKVEQGITTEVAGFCGFSFAPVSKGYFNQLKMYLRFIIEGLNTPDEWVEFSTFGRYMDEVEKLKLGPNMAFFVGQGTIRIAVMGFENRKATGQELKKMKDLVREAMKSGAVGLSTGLIYPPGVYTPKEELVELCEVVAEYRGIYASHIRNESHDVVNAVAEAIDIGRQSGTPVLISHHKVAGRENWGKSRETLKLIDRANEEGIEVLLDQYPYEAGFTALNATIPPEFHEGGIERLIERLKDGNIRVKIKNAILDKESGWENLAINCGFDGILVLSAQGVPEAVGKTISEYASRNGLDAFEALFDLLIKTKGSASAAYFEMNDIDIERIMKYPSTMVGTDGDLIVPGIGSHPRCIGTFPRILGRYVREKKVLSLEEAIKKMTSLPASKIGLKLKGLVREGFDADLVLFDPHTIIDKASYVKPYLKNQGINYVIINGKIAVKNNEYTGAAPGKVIRIFR